MQPGRAGATTRTSSSNSPLSTALTRTIVSLPVQSRLVSASRIVSRACAFFAIGMRVFEFEVHHAGGAAAAASTRSGARPSTIRHEGRNGA